MFVLFVLNFSVRDQKTYRPQKDNYSNCVSQQTCSTDYHHQDRNTFGKLNKSIICRLISFWCHLQGVPKKIGILSSFEFLGLGEVFLGVKNNSKNFGNKKNIGLLSKILSKLTLFIRKMQKCWCFYEFMAMLRMEIFFSCHKSHYLCIYSYKY